MDGRTDGPTVGQTLLSRCVDASKKFTLAKGILVLYPTSTPHQAGQKVTNRKKFEIESNILAFNRSRFKRRDAMRLPQNHIKKLRRPFSLKNKLMCLKEGTKTVSQIRLQIVCWFVGGRAIEDIFSVSWLLD